MSRAWPFNHPVHLGPVLLGRRFAALNKTIKTAVPGPIQAPLTAQMRDRALWTIENTFTSLLLAILFLMTVKPNLLGTGIVVSIGIVVGLLSTQVLTLSTFHAILCSLGNPSKNRKI